MVMPSACDARSSANIAAAARRAPASSSAVLASMASSILGGYSGCAPRLSSSEESLDVLPVLMQRDTVLTGQRCKRCQDDSSRVHAPSGNRTAPYERDGPEEPTTCAQCLMFAQQLAP